MRRRRGIGGGGGHCGDGDAGDGFRGREKEERIRETASNIPVVANRRAPRRSFFTADSNMLWVSWRSSRTFAQVYQISVRRRSGGVVTVLLGYERTASAVFSSPRNIPEGNRRMRKKQ